MLKHKMSKSSDNVSTVERLLCTLHADERMATVDTMTMETQQGTVTSRLHTFLRR